MRGVYFEVDGLSVDALVVASYPRSLILDLSFYVLEVCESTIGDVMKLCPFRLHCNTCGTMRYVDLVSFWRIILAGNIDKLENERSPCDYPTAPRQEISSNYIFEYRGFPRGLRTNDNLKFELKHEP